MNSPALFIRYLLKMPGSNPRDVQIEITNECNLTCGMCTRTSMQAPAKHMAMSTYETILRRLPVLTTVTLTGWGEPLCHPHFFEMVKLIKSAVRGVTVKATTNGFLINQNSAQHLIDCGIDKLTVSIDRIVDMGSGNNAGHPASKKVQDVIGLLASAAGAGHGPKVCLQTVLFNRGLQDVFDVIDFCRKAHVPSINLVRLDTRTLDGITRPSKTQETELIAAIRQKARDCGVTIYSINQQSIPLYLAGHGGRICLRSMHSAYITVDGMVTPCCDLRKHNVGDLHKEKLSDVWRGGRFRAFRKNQRAICQKCDALKPTRLY